MVTINKLAEMQRGNNGKISDATIRDSFIFSA